VQESLLNTVKKIQQAEQKINVEELEVILNSDIEEVVALCKKACLKPKTDNMGNTYFTKNDVDVLKKMKELYAQSQNLQQTKVEKNENSPAPEMQIDTTKKINFLQKAKSRAKQQDIAYPSAVSAGVVGFKNQIDRLENNLISKMSELLSEKMDGFDEIIVELIRAKTENENLRQQVNGLNKQVFILKNELASFNPIAFGLYTKKDTEVL